MVAEPENNIEIPPPPPWIVFGGGEEADVEEDENDGADRMMGEERITQEVPVYSKIDMLWTDMLRAILGLSPRSKQEYICGGACANLQGSSVTVYLKQRCYCAEEDKNEKGGRELFVCALSLFLCVFLSVSNFSHTGALAGVTVFLWSYALAVVIFTVLCMFDTVQRFLAAKSERRRRAEDRLEFLGALHLFVRDDEERGEGQQLGMEAAQREEGHRRRREAEGRLQEEDRQREEREEGQRQAEQRQRNLIPTTLLLYPPVRLIVFDPAEGEGDGEGEERNADEKKLTDVFLRAVLVHIVFLQYGAVPILRLFSLLPHFLVAILTHIILYRLLVAGRANATSTLIMATLCFLGFIPFLATNSWWWYPATIFLTQLNSISTFRMVGRIFFFKSIFEE